MAGRRAFNNEIYKTAGDQYLRKMVLIICRGHINFLTEIRAAVLSSVLWGAAVFFGNVFVIRPNPKVRALFVKNYVGVRCKWVSHIYLLCLNLSLQAQRSDGEARHEKTRKLTAHFINKGRVLFLRR